MKGLIKEEKNKEQNKEQNSKKRNDVSAADKSTGMQKKITITNDKVSLSKEQIERLVNE